MKELSEIMKIADRQERLIEARLYQEAKKGFAEGFAKSRAEERVRILKRYRIFLDSTGFSDELKKVCMMVLLPLSVSIWERLLKL